MEEFFKFILCCSIILFCLSGFAFFCIVGEESNLLSIRYCPSCGIDLFKGR